jgi:SAM-dependent methyltransferase
VADFFRAAMYDALRPLLLEEIPRRLEALEPLAEISGDALRQEFGAKDVDVLEFPTFDLLQATHTLDRASTYGVILADQVLEHVRDPELALRGIQLMLRPGGLAVVTTVASFPLHNDDQYGDFWRFQPRGLAELFALSPTWRDVRVGSWGNRRAVVYSLEWEKYRDSPMLAEVARQPNDPRYPLMVWAVAWKAD